jgi:exportin-1
LSFSFHPQRSEAEKVMTSLQEHEMMWTRADAILEQSSNPNTKFFALQVLEGVIKYRWNALPDDQREGIKNFISNLIIKLSTDAVSFRRDRAFINKVNAVLVQILKHDWPVWWAPRNKAKAFARTA